MRRLPRLSASLSVALALLALVAASPPPAAADLASRVADLETSAGPNRSSAPFGFERVGSRTVFFALSPAGLVEPWTTDGTPEGTARLPGPAVRVQPLGSVGDACLWFALEETGTIALWRSGGVAASTGRLIAAGVDEPLFREVSYARGGGRLYFFRHGAGSVLELWATDGGGATERVATLPGVTDDVLAMAFHRGAVYFRTADYVTPGPGSEGDWENWRLWRIDPANGRSRLLSAGGPGPAETLFPTSGRLLFTTGAGVWATDGTAGGTGPVAGPPGEPGFEWTGAVGVAGGRLYFGGRAPGRAEALWVSDGTGAGTRRLAIPLKPVAGLADLGERVLFAAASPALGIELWTTGGTAETTAPVTDLCPGPCSSMIDPFPYGANLAAAGDRAYLLADDGAAGRRLWVTDGTAAGTTPLLGVEGGEWVWALRMTVDAGEVFLYRSEPGGDIALWASDGTAAGTRRLASLGPADPFPTYDPRWTPSFAAHGARLDTAAFDPRAGLEPFALRRDGGGGRLLADVARGGDAAGSDPREAVALGDRLVFLTRRSDGSMTAWSTRGTAETTFELARLPLGPGLLPTAAAAAGGLAYLTADDLWATDGTPGGTMRVTDFAATAPGSRIGTPILELGGRAVFGVTSASGRSALWTSDGTAAGTGPANPSLPVFQDRILHPATVGDELWFWGFIAGEGWELRAVDAGFGAVRRLTHRTVTLQTPVPPEYTRIGSTVYFLASEGPEKVDVWGSDGTAEGTVRVAPPPVAPENWQRTLGAVGDRLLLLVSSRYHTRSTLWAGGGSGGDWVELHDFGALEVGGFLRRSSDLLFPVGQITGGGAAYDVRLWRTDGTVEGTRLAVDLVALGAPETGAVTRVGDRLYLAAGPRWQDQELWISDGTTASTRRLQEIAPGLASSRPDGFVQVGDRLYFWADDGLHGRELWSLPLAELDAPCRPSASALCLGDGRFRAELFRHDRAGARGDGRAVPWSSAAGAFWLYAYGNPEAVVKMVDGGPVNGFHWLFYGPLGDAYVALTVTDLETGDSRRYPEDPGPLAAFADLATFPSGGTASVEAPDLLAGLEIAAAAEPLAIATAARACRTPEPCVPGPTRLCLHGGRFGVELFWTDPAGAEHAARVFAHGDRAGYFAFHGARDLQAAFKLLDGRPVNGRYWLFATSLTHLGYTLRVTDTAAGEVREYLKPAGVFASVIDVSGLG